MLNLSHFFAMLISTFIHSFLINREHFLALNFVFYQCLLRVILAAVCKWFIFGPRSRLNLRKFIKWSFDVIIFDNFV